MQLTTSTRYALAAIMSFLCFLQVACVHSEPENNGTPEPVVYSLPLTDLANNSPIVSLQVTEPAGVARDSVYISQGIPLPSGQYWQKDLDQWVLRDEKGHTHHLTTQILSVWPDQSVRWVKLGFYLSLEENETLLAAVINHQGVASNQNAPPSLKVDESEEQIAVDTGPLKVVFSKKSGRIFDSIQHHSNELVDSTLPSGPWLKLVEKGQEYLFSGQALKRATIPDLFLPQPWQAYSRYPLGKLSVTLESKTASEVVVRISGSYTREDLEVPANQGIDRKTLPLNHSFFSIRCRFIAGLNTFDIDHGFIFSGQEHDQIAELGFTVPIASSAPESIIYTSWNKGEHRKSKKVRLLDKPISAAISAPGVVLMMQDLALHYPAGLSSGSEGQNEGLHALFHPKITSPKNLGPMDMSRYSHKVASEHAEVGTVANRAAQGIGKNYKLRLSFGDQYYSQNAKQLAIAFDGGDPRIDVDPEWVSKSSAVGIGPFTFSPSKSDYHFRAHQSLQIIEHFMRFNQRQQFHWFGRWNYGDIRGRFQGGKNASNTWYKLGRYGWAGNSGEPLKQLWVQYFRQPSSALWRDAVAMSQHTAHVQMVHYGDLTERNHQWLGRNEVSSIGSLHRHGQQVWSGYAGEEDYSHVAGLELYYYLTADQGAKDALYEAAQFVLRKSANTSKRFFPNGYEVLTTAARVFYDRPILAAQFRAGAEQLHQQLLAPTPDFFDHWLNDHKLAAHYHLLLRFIPGIIAEHEYSQRPELADFLIRFAKALPSKSEHPSLYYEGNLAGYGLHLMGTEAPESLKVFAENYLKTLALCNTIPEKTWHRIPSDWQKWQWHWDKNLHFQDSPGILWLSRKIHFNNDFMQDYHSYRAFIHVPTLAFATKGGSCSTD